MFVLITYDVNITSEDGAKRLRRIAKLCKDYGQRVQNSVFECIVTESQYLMLKAKIKDTMSEESDSVRFYLIGSKWKRKVDILGNNHGCDFTEELII